MKYAKYWGAIANHSGDAYFDMHLASALAWSESLGETVAVATYDRELWRGARASGLSAWPAATP